MPADLPSRPAFRSYHDGYRIGSVIVFLLLASKNSGSRPQTEPEVALVLALALSVGKRRSGRFPVPTLFASKLELPKSNRDLYLVYWR